MGITGSSNTPGNSSVPLAMASVAVPPVWLASKSSVAPLRPGVPGCTRGGAAGVPAGAGVVGAVAAGAGCEATRRPLTRPLAW
ncbi:hypothetical protein D9M69_645990 [compost metagenome]